MDESRRRIVDWIGREVLPHEGDLRRWLRRSMVAAADVDDIVQESYCKLAALDDVGHIANPRAYLFQVARSIVLNQLRRARIVRIDTVTEIDSLDIVLDEPSPERVAGGRRDLARALRLIAELPDRCRRVVEMRKIEELPQKEIARRLGVTETVVENDVMKGLRHVLRATAQGEIAAERAARMAGRDERTRNRAAD